MTPQPQRLFIITEENLDKLVKNGVSKKSEEIAYLVKQCPHQPAAPSERCKDCPYSEPCKECDFGNPEHDATIRNETLDALITRVQDEEMFLGMAADNSEIYYLTGHHIRKIIDSLRSTNPQEQ